MERARNFAVVIAPEEEGGFTVRIPALPEIVTYGEDEAEALAMAEDAIRLVLEDCLARGEPLPSGEPPQIREGYRHARGMTDFRYNERVALGVGDVERTGKALAGIVGKRPLYGDSSVG